MQEQYKAILLQYIGGGCEAELELAYEIGRKALDRGIGMLDLIDTHNEALDTVLETTETPEQRLLVLQRATSLLKEILAPFEMTRMGYAETISLLRNQNEKLMKVMEERSELLKQREDFMVVLTHDLKTPITAADRCISLMLEGDFGELRPNQVELLSTMKESNLRMFAMVKNLLEVYKYEQSTPVLCLVEVNLKSLLQTVVEESKLLAQVHGITVNTKFSDDLQRAWADEMAIRHVIANLLDNAIKFTPRGGSISISASNLENSLLIEVQDTGKGISAEEQQRLFQRFFQAETGRRQRTGTGLGLYLSKQIIKAHNGEISCQSEVGAGTTFRIVLPACAPLESNGI